jgi:hypothetical protein
LTTVEIDVAALVGAILGPFIILVLLWWFREPLSMFARELPRRLKSFSAAGVSFELADATPSSLTSLQVSVDLRHAGTSNDVNDSTLRSFYEQIEDPTRIDYAVVDLGTGEEWLSSRLFVLSIILQRMRGLQAFVFVENINDVRRRFLGVCEARPLRWRLAARWPRFQSAFAAAELHVWGHPYDDVTQTLPVPPRPGGMPMDIQSFSSQAQNVAIVNDEGRMLQWGGPEAAAALLRAFLDAVQRPGLAAPSPEWQQLPSDLPRCEYSVWLTGALLDGVLHDSLDKRSLRLHDLQGWTEALRTRAVLEHSRNWVAVTRDEAIFDRLINRQQALEQIASQIASRA